MTYGAVVKGTFRARPNRFIAQVDTEEGTQVCHVKNTGRCKELLVPGATVYLAEGKNPARKTKYDLVAVEKGQPAHQHGQPGAQPGGPGVPAPAAAGPHRLEAGAGVGGFPF